MADLGYARVSTLSQDPGPQVAALHQAGCMKVWVEVASGYRDDRPRLAELLGYARPGDRLTVTRLDRVGRSVPHLLQLAGELAGRGVQLRSLADSIDTSSAGGRLVFVVMAAIAEFEGNLRRERQEAAWAAGKQRGRPPSMNPDQVALARQLRAEGRSLAEIARALGVGKSTVYRTLQQEAA